MQWKIQNYCDQQKIFFFCKYRIMYPEADSLDKKVLALERQVIKASQYENQNKIHLFTSAPKLLLPVFAITSLYFSENQP